MKETFTIVLTCLLMLMLPTCATTLFILGLPLCNSTETCWMAFGRWLYHWQQMIGIVLTFVGIYFAFQLNNWNNMRAERREQKLQRIALAKAMIYEIERALGHVSAFQELEPLWAEQFNQIAEPLRYTNSFHQTVTINDDVAVKAWRVAIAYDHIRAHAVRIVESQTSEMSTYKWTAQRIKFKNHCIDLRKTIDAAVPEATGQNPWQDEQRQSQQS